MNIFAIEKIREIEGNTSFYKLYINDRCEFDEFCLQIEQEGSYLKELITIQTRMHAIADRQLLPQEKFKAITPQGETVKEYEIKTKHLRVYLFHEENTGKIIVYGGKKTSQKQDIKRFRSLKKLYLNSKRRKLC